MKLLPLRNFEAAVTEDMEDALNWYCAQCQTRGIGVVSAEHARAFLRDEERRPDLAAAFVSELLCPHPEDVL